MYILGGPDGAFAIGIKIGRRNCDTLLMDFTGKVRDRASLSYDYPDPQVLFAHLQKQLNELPAHIGSPLAERILGVGIAAQVQAVTALPVQQVKDTAAACVAELVAGPRAQRTQLCP